MNQKGSSIYWIILILVIVGVAALLFPRYQTVTNELNQSKAQNVASSLTALAASNYSLRKSKHTEGAPITNCKDISKLNGANLPSGYEIQDQSLSPDELSECNLIAPTRTDPIKFHAIGIS